MKTIQYLLKLSAKATFQELRSKSPLLCKTLNEKIYITKKLYNHISFAKPRGVEEVSERLAIIPLLPQIMSEGSLTEKRGNFYKVSLTFDRVLLSVVIQKNRNKHILISCFRDLKHKKRDLS